MKLSIITINLNNRTGLQKTIDSVINQTWKDYEWIIIDGGSTDGSRELIEQYQQYLAYWCSESDDGVYYAMNKGIAKANGYYLNFMNSGDTFHNREVLYKVFSSNLIGDVVYGNWYNLKKEKSYLKEPPIHATLEFFYADNICHQAMFIKTSILKEKAYDVDFQIYADWARWIKMYIQGSVFQYLPIVICQYDAICGKSNRETLKCREELERLHDLFPSFIRTLIKRKNLLLKELYTYRHENDTKAIRNLPMGVNFRTKIVHFELFWVDVLIRRASKAMRRFNKLFHKLLICVRRFKCNMLNIRYI